MRNGRCRMHGGVSTGPKTVEGLARSRRLLGKEITYRHTEAASQPKQVESRWVAYPPLDPAHVAASDVG
jgi:hypothetical protein